MVVSKKTVFMVKASFYSVISRGRSWLYMGSTSRKRKARAQNTNKIASVLVTSGIYKTCTIFTFDQEVTYLHKVYERMPVI